MSIYDTILTLCEEKGIAPTALEKKLGFSNGSIGKMKKSGTSAKRLQKIADYFGVSIDYLMTGSAGPGNEWHQALTPKEELDIEKQLEATMNRLDCDSGLMFSGEILDDETKELLKASLETTIKNAKLMAKKKYTPKKYKKRVHDEG